MLNIIAKVRKFLTNLDAPLISGCKSSGFDGVKAVMVHRLGTQGAATVWFYTFVSRG